MLRLSQHLGDKRSGDGADLSKVLIVAAVIMGYHPSSNAYALGKY